MEPMGSTRSAPPDDQNLAGSPDLEEQRETRWQQRLRPYPTNSLFRKLSVQLIPTPHRVGWCQGRGRTREGEVAEPRTPATVAEVDARS